MPPPVEDNASFTFTINILFRAVRGCRISCPSNVNGVLVVPLLTFGVGIVVEVDDEDAAVVVVNTSISSASSFADEEDSVDSTATDRNKVVLIWCPVDMTIEDFGADGNHP
jgi:hypothetical protein